MGEKLLKIENLSKSYNAQTQALADVNITLDKGEFVVVIGPSGAGPTQRDKECAARPAGSDEFLGKCIRTVSAG